MPRRALDCAALLLVFALVLPVLAGCTGTPAASDRDSGSDWVRDVSPFAVNDSSGTPIQHPFLGGLNVPRPQLVDIDNDGDQDLFLQEDTNELRFFERVDVGADSSRLVWRTDHYKGLDIGEWFRFADLDGDGDADLLAEKPFSYIRMYENTGSSGQPEFSMITDTLKTPGGEAVFSDRQNIPTVADVDCNNRLDLFIGRLDGTVDRYEASEEMQAGTMPMFELVTEKYEDIEIVNQIGTLHGANTLAFADPDQDGDLDLFWGDFFEPGLLLIENRGRACATPDLRGTPQPFPPNNPMSTSGYNAPTLGDVTKNGDLDVLVGVLGGAYDATKTLTNNLYFYENDGSNYTLQTRQYVGGLDVGNESVGAAGDIDGDGDIDLLLSNKIEPSTGISSQIRIIENVGSTDSPAFQMRGQIDMPDAYRFAPALGDLDGDGDPDMIVGTWNGDLLFAENDAGSFTVNETPIVSIPRGSNAVPSLGDIDGDGDLDLLVGEGSGTINVFRNDGSPEAPDFTLQTEDLEGVSVKARSAPHLTDLDGDGHLDLLVGSELAGIFVYRGAGDGSFEANGELSVDAPKLTAPFRADLDGDGAPELLSGGDGGGLLFWNLR
ncbi:hypothetical protein CRI94_04200 [Longibacter salinarum]|uniref:VCBS repeat-containing protein n=1 Tax=Longibacter salinarum TaxID=1850348 RepID=A0A2A8D0R8_9BACT|nr:VCBS repeat-containing protein [Longibacter salinarum]PEN14248.1 hypothetical protein CRI94_04200 [Longibacter salinarum]